MKNRKLFYIYSYINGTRQRNVGFAECKRKDTKYNINLSLKIPQEYFAENMNIYIYEHDNGEINGFKLGTVNPTWETCKFSTVIDTRKLEDKGLSANKISGIYIFSHEYDGYVFGTGTNEENIRQLVAV